MIAVVGGSVVTLKRIMLEDGFPHLSNYTAMGRTRTNRLAGVFNCSYTPPQMLEYVFRRWRYVETDLAIINKKIIGNKLTAQTTMESAGMSEHILGRATSSRSSGSWVVKPFATQGGRGIRRYRLRDAVRPGTYLQIDAEKLREFRAHVGLWLDNPVFTIQEKKPKPELWRDVFGNNGAYEWPLHNTDIRNRFPVTWNVESGFYFRRTTTPDNRADKARRFGLIRRIEEVAIKAIKALGYQYGAVDILMDTERHLWVTEINSHPAIKNEDSKRIYLQALAPLKTISTTNMVRLTESASGGGTTRRTFERGRGFTG